MSNLGLHRSFQLQSRNKCRFLHSSLSPPSRAVATIDSVNPATQEINAQFAVTQPADLPAIFARARSAQKDWAARPLRERCAMLRHLRDAIFARREEIADVITREAGKPRVEAIFAEILLALDTADFLARQVPRWLRPERVPHHNLAMKAKSGWLEYDPLGVVAIISPWNYPFSIPMAQVIPALATGNAVLLKPSELTPWCGQLVGELVEQAKISPGLVQVLARPRRARCSNYRSRPRQSLLHGKRLDRPDASPKPAPKN